MQLWRMFCTNFGNFLAMCSNLVIWSSSCQERMNWLKGRWSYWQQLLKPTSSAIRRRAFSGKPPKEKSLRTMAHPRTWLKSVLTFRSLYSSPICGLFTLSETFQTFVKCCRTAVVSLVEIYILKVIHWNPLTTGQWDVSVILHGNWHFSLLPCKGLGVQSLEQ